MVKLRMAHVNLTILTLYTEIVRATAVSIAVSSMSTVVTIPNAVTLVNAMTLLATPITFIHQLVGVSCPQSTN